MSNDRIFIGTAGWSLPADQRESFGDGDSMLARYATRFDCVEINSSFHRRHRPATWQRWADSVPADFRFSVKVPKTITHERKLVDCHDLIAELGDDICGLGAKLAVLLVQLPPKLAFSAREAERFFIALAALGRTQIVCEPRHPSWFEAESERMLGDLKISRVAADPPPVPAAAAPGGWDGFAYWRLHGSPRMYRSSYDDGRLADYARAMAARRPAWCIFDNTASSAATGDALALKSLLAA
jgi:uncharacterized protein YecE (DUF72 family)